MCQSPERLWDRIGASHPDHLAAGEAAVCAVYPDARNPFAHPELLEEGLEPHTVPEIWMVAGREANRAVDITDTFDLKISALRRHRSQVGEGEWLDERIRTWVTGPARRPGFPRGTWPRSSRSSWPPDRTAARRGRGGDGGARPALGGGPARAARGSRAPGPGALAMPGCSSRWSGSTGARRSPLPTGSEA